MYYEDVFQLMVKEIKAQINKEFAVGTQINLHFSPPIPDTSLISKQEISMHIVTVNVLVFMEIINMP